MSKRKALNSGLLLAGLVAALYFGPGGYWRVRGWLDNEPSYAGWPASYWRHEADRCSTLEIEANNNIVLRNADDFYSMSELKPRWLRHDVWHLDHPLMQGNPAAVSVLLELLKDDRPNIRIIALCALARIGPGAEEAVPAIREAATDQATHGAADYALFCIERR